MQASDAALRADMLAGDAALRSEMHALRLELKSDIAETKAELKHDINEQSKKLSALESGQIFLQRLFFGGTLATLTGIVVLFLHQG
jgi:hypothetical protein